MEIKSWQFFIVTLILHICKFTSVETADTVKFVVECETPSADSPNSKVVNVRALPSLGSSILGGRRPLDSIMESSNLRKNILPVQPKDLEPVVGSIKNGTDQDMQSSNSGGTSLFKNDSPILSKANEFIGKLRSNADGQPSALPNGQLLENLRSRVASAADGQPLNLPGSQLLGNLREKITSATDTQPGNLLENFKDRVASGGNDQTLVSHGNQLLGNLKEKISSITNGQPLSLPGSEILENIRGKSTSAVSEPIASESKTSVGLIERLKQSIDNPSAPQLPRSKLIENLQTSRKAITEREPEAPESPLANFRSLLLNPTLTKPSDSQGAATNDQSSNTRTLPLGRLALGPRGLNNQNTDSNARGSQDQLTLPRLQPLLRSNQDQSNPSQTPPNRDISALSKNADTIVKDISATIGEAISVLKQTSDGLKKALSIPAPLPLPINLNDTGLQAASDSVGANTSPILRETSPGDNAVEETNPVPETCDICNCLMKYIPKDVENGKFIMNDRPVLATIQLTKLPALFTDKNSTAVEEDHIASANIVSPAYVLPPRDMFPIEHKGSFIQNAPNDMWGIEKATEVDVGIQKLIEFVNIVDQVDQFISNQTKHLITRLSEFYDDNSKSQTS